jgi:hypothetical protein
MFQPAVQASGIAVSPLGRLQSCGTGEQQGSAEE